MIKRLIFDLDNTLIMWKDEYKNAIKKTIEHYNLDIDYLKMDKVIEEYEIYYDKYDKNNFIELINKKFNLNLQVDFIDYWLKELGNMAEENLDLIELLKYLSGKYELVILTNWFKESQLKRLKTAKIDKYFINIYDGEECIKPNEKSFIKAMGPYNKNECIMIGDIYKIDIEPANKLGIKTIMVSDKIHDDTTNISNVLELKEML